MIQAHGVADLALEQREGQGLAWPGLLRQGLQEIGAGAVQWGIPPAWRLNGLLNAPVLESARVQMDEQSSQS
jgi:hypothetical protein